MRIEIEIPKEFEGDYNADRFSDFFSRAMIDIETMQGMCGRYEIETAEMLQKAFAESKVAYDVEAVVAELEEMLKNGLSCSECNVEISYGGYCFGNCEENAFAKAISIVRGKE